MTALKLRLDFILDSFEEYYECLINPFGIIITWAGAKDWACTCKVNEP